MNCLKALRALPLAALLAVAALPASAQDDADLTTAKEVRTEISEAMGAIADYTAQERDQAIAAGSDALDRLDAEIDRRGQALREHWADMSESARETAQESLEDLRAARNELGERYGALKAGTADAWGDLKSEFTEAWESFSDTWSEADKSAQSD